MSSIKKLSDDALENGGFALGRKCGALLPTASFSSRHMRI
jgi:hypothetical protein